MAPRKIPSRKIPGEEYEGRWKNALGRRGAMEREFLAGSYDPALVLATQAVIAACDAFTIFHRGERSASDRHLDAIAMLSHVTGVPGLEEARLHLSKVLREKAEIEYSGKTPKPKEAERLVEHARRFIDFVSEHLPGG